MFLLEILSEIPARVNTQLNDKDNKIWYAKPYLYIILYFVALKEWFPYTRALTHIAYNRYKETTMYRERLISFGEKFALDHFVENREYKFFMRHITRKEKLKAFFVPFNYIRGV